MLTSEDLKYWIRSGSFSFMRNRRRRDGGGIETVLWRGRPIHYRPGTSDLTLIYRILLKPEAKREYRLPEGLRPRTVLDIGANIGIASAWLSDRFPEARIVSFEPAPQNLEVLRRNVIAFPRVEISPVALGARDGELELRYSDDPANFGGFSFFDEGVDPQRKVRVPVREVRGCLAGLGVSEVDLIKIDTEGAEHEILTAMDPAVLARVRWILGELHGQKDFELLAYLSRWFEVSVHKPLGSRLGEFQARNRSLRLG